MYVLSVSVFRLIPNVCCSIGAQLVCVYLYKKFTIGIAVDIFLFFFKREVGAKPYINFRNSFYFCWSFTACEVISLILNLANC